MKTLAIVLGVISLVGFLFCAGVVVLFVNTQQRIAKQTEDIKFDIDVDSIDIVTINQYMKTVHFMYTNQSEFSIQVSKFDCSILNEDGSVLATDSLLNSNRDPVEPGDTATAKGSILKGSPLLRDYPEGSTVRIKVNARRA